MEEQPEVTMQQETQQEDKPVAMEQDEGWDAPPARPEEEQRGRSPSPARGRRADSRSPNPRRGASGSRDGSRQEETAQSIYLRGLAEDTLATDLAPIFEKYGPVRDIYIPKDFYSNRARGFAYVQYKFQPDAEEAMRKIEYLEIGGRQLNMEWAKGNRKTAHEMRRTDNRDR
jgi:RNA recognition motif-containing protein